MAKIELPDLSREHEDASTIGVDEMRSIMKEKGVVPPRKWDERPICVTCSADIVDPFDPDKPPLTLKQRTKDLALRVYERPVAKIAKYLPDFDPKLFAAEEAVSIYRKAHELLAKLGSTPDLMVTDEDLLQYVTEKCFPEMLYRLDRKTIHWKWMGNLEPPKFVKATVIPGIDGLATFGQVTIRFHSQQVCHPVIPYPQLTHVLLRLWPSTISSGD